MSRLATFAQPNIEPTLSEEELEDILDQNARAARWITATVYTVGQVVIPTVSNGHYYVVITAGTTTTEPTWPESQGGTVTAGAEFQEAGLSFTSLYNLREAKRMVAELKKIKSSEFISTSDSGSEQQIHQHWVEIERSLVTPMVV